MNTEKSLHPKEAMPASENNPEGQASGIHDRGDIAIIGMACRFPGAENYQQFWENLCQGISSITEVPNSRWDKDAYYSGDVQDKNKSVSKWGGFVDGVEYFDADFFGISGREAAVMDPQQRIMLEQTWACMEDAGYDPKNFSGTRTGVYVGVFNFDYQDHLGKALDAIEAHVSTGTHTALIPNRISHFFNLHGPSLPIDTACSSSLVALHKAAHAIRRGECDHALVGGVSVLCSPTHFISFSKTGMLSPDGSCKSFDERANGYVRGEGAGMILLKPLRKAIADNDRILAVVRGTAINHGGRARTVTYPGSLAQSGVIAEALAQADIPIATVGYVEAHGTGTPKGDPIEIEGLKLAYARIANEQGEDLPSATCGIGSVKTNIGHLESVAGLAGLIKTILCMKQQTLPGLVHYQKLNPRINLEGSPFYIVDKSRPWASPVGTNGQTIPRRAGISSFGFGGVNSHAIIEEFPAPQQDEPGAEQTPVLVILSAKTQAVLRNQVQNMLTAIALPEVQRGGLRDFAFTLQTGRQAMSERLALVVDSFAGLQRELQDWLAGSTRTDKTLSGRVTAEDLLRIAGEPSRSISIATLLADRDLSSLARDWVKGHDVDWTMLHSTEKRRRIALPTYPFVRERHWIDANSDASPMPVGAESALHPLLHRNTSNLSGLRFSSTFTGKEFFLADHVVQGTPTLPGVAQLEMVWCAANQALPQADPRLLKDIVWMRPITVGEQPLELHVALFPEEDGEIGFEIYRSAGEESEAVLFSQGTIATGLAAPAQLDLPALRSQCAALHLEPAQCYAKFKQAGLQYGPAHQAMRALYIGQGQALAQIELPPALLGSRENYTLHPSLLDAALQAAIAFHVNVASDSGESSPMLPFALEGLEILAPCKPNMWASVRYCAGSGAYEAVQKFDIDLCDEAGMVCVRFNGFCARVAGQSASVDEPLRTALFQPAWKQEPASSVPGIVHARHLVLVFGDVNEEELHASMPGTKILSISLSDDLAHDYERAACALLEQVQAMHALPGQHMVQIVVPVEGVAYTMSGLGGLLRCAQLENPRISGQVIAIGDGQKVPSVLAENLHCGSIHVRYVNAKREICQWEEIPAAKLEISESGKTWKDRGVYLITGGAGGLGLIFAHDIVGKTKNSVLILTGRSLPSESTLSKIRALEALGAVVQYRQVDVGDASAMTDLVQGIAEEFESLDGIIHAAGVLRDSFIVNKTADQMRDVLRAKVAGLINLDQASRDMPLDCFICFSSTSGALGNVGQADYGAANAFMDAFAQRRAGLVERGARHGCTLALNWPLWEQGGMQVDAATREELSRRTGLIALRTDSAVRAMMQALTCGQAQVMVAEGAIARFTASLAQVAAPAAVSSKPGPEQAASADLREKANRYFVRLLCTTLKRPVNSIDPHAQLETYGIDSILVVDLTRTLEQVFGTLSKTLFFEYQTIAALADYFLQNHRTELVGALGESSVETISEPTPIAVATPTPRRQPRFGTGHPIARDRALRATEAANTVASHRGRTSVDDDIAIIGLAGRYPQAGNVEEFWANLCAGKDCITEIPSERWDYKLYYDQDRNKAGKTYSKWGGFIDGVDLFDPLFFNISPREAELMDPQERLFLECVYAAVEDAGYTRETVAQGATNAVEGSVGVYVGVMYEEYQLYGAQEQARGNNLGMFGSAASIANRISYFCNFNGPSIALDTMCSSSLTAIHLACQSLQRGGCSVAIAGGVNVSIHPNKYLMLAQGKFISGKGRCESFGEGGEGYVPGEGVGAILLKPKAQAIADGDHIYGVIRASAVNHGGKTNGYTVPNPNAQAKVIERALREADIDARTISYVEAHGTGTTLGDPIEIAGLSKAFSNWTQERQYCAIGSAKSNIGHCESAAGIAGVTKVLLQLKHRQLVPSLHSQYLNPNIDFTKSPFVVQQELGPWQRPVLESDGVQREYPRIAGISSFGAGGANAHVVIEEYIAPTPSALVHTAEARPGPALVVLSARSEERLVAQASQLLAAIDVMGAQTVIDLADLAYTLQVGREAMEERLAFLVDSIADLHGKLEAFVAGNPAMDDFYRGQVKRNKETLATLAGDDDMSQTIEAWIAKGKFGKLLDLWVKGLTFDWRKLYGARLPKRISLPTYPFARERYWVQSGNAIETTAAASGAHLHPLLHRNTSDISGLRFSTDLRGDEFFLAEHVVQGDRILPGVAQLEMARRAVCEAVGIDCHIELVDVAWVRPVRVGDEGLQLHLALYPEDDAEIRFEIYSAGGEDEIVVHSQGVVLVDETEEAGTSVTCDLDGVRTECSLAHLDKEQIYPVFARAGLQYGAAFRGLSELHAGAQQVLARISLPSSALSMGDAGRYGLHPSLLDAALQASMGLQTGLWLPEGQASIALMVPFALGSLVHLAPCQPSMWAHVRFSTGSSANDVVQKLDIDLCDDAGVVCVRFTEFSMRMLQSNASAGSAEPAFDGTLLLAPTWDVMPLPDAVRMPAAEARVVMLGGTPLQQQGISDQYRLSSVLALGNGATLHEIEDSLRAQGVIDHIVWVVGEEEQAGTQDDEALIAAQERGVVLGFRLVKALLALGFDSRALGWTVVTTQTQAVHACDALSPAHAGVHGFIGSLAKEMRRWQVRLVDMPQGTMWPIEQMFHLPFDPNGDAFAWRSGQWFRQQLVPTIVNPGPDSAPLYRQGGVYVVIGGAGGIGQAWSEHVIREHQANVVWIGRRARDESIEQAQARLGQFGPAPTYIAADAADLGAMQRACEQILARFPAIHGVMHAAIVLLDKSLAQMDEERLLAGLSAKVDVSVRMAQVFGGLQLDFMLFCSSLLSFIKAAGQSNYAAGCTFKDAYGLLLAKRLPYPVKVMNWGYWGSVGVVASQTYSERMAQQGIASIEVDEGMRAIDTLLGSRSAQLGFLKVTAAGLKGGIHDLIATSRVQTQYTTDGFPRIVLAPQTTDAKIPANAARVQQQRLEIDQASLAILCGELNAMGLFRPDTLEMDLAAASGRLGLRPGYERWLAHSLEQLAQAGLVTHNAANGTWRASHGADDTMVLRVWADWDLRKAAWLDEANLRAQVVLLESMLQELPAILQGRTPATAVMFPNSSMHLVEGVYQGSAVTDYYNDVLSDKVCAFVEARLKQDPAARIRILEIGAGTGGTSARVLTRLAPYTASIDQYCYTDLSRAFLLHAEKKYGPHYAYLNYQLFDVGAPPSAQGIAAGSYDMVIATNVLHATKDIRLSLRNAKAVLRTKGLLLLNELSSCELWAHLTFGLLDGWWLYEDEALRIPGCPSLAPEQWETVLQEEGYDNVQFPAREAHALGQQVVVAESDGIVLQIKNTTTPAKVSVAASALASALASAPASALASGPAAVRRNLQKTTVLPVILPATPTTASTPGHTPASLREKSLYQFKKLVGQTLKMPLDKIDSGTNLDQYGIDSILVLELTNSLRAAFADSGIGNAISTTLFFEYQSIEALTDHFIRTDPAAMMRWTGLDAEVEANRPGTQPVIAQAVTATQAKPVLARWSSGGRSITPVATRGAAAQFDVAIIGLSGRYPQANDLGQFWENLKAGRNCISEVPPKRWDHSLYFDERKNQAGKTYSRWAGFLNDVDCFDPLFFNISPREAETMSPQERLFLQEAYASIEDAGYTPAGLSGSRKVGMFVGVMNERYPAGSRFWSIANRTSYFFNFQGPSMAVDTACSASLTAVHLAVESLRSGSSEIAIAGGVNLIVDPEHLVTLSEMTMLSSGDKCKSFAADGDGFVDGEAVGAMVLKPLQHAIADGDHIYGVIKGSAINSGGKTNAYMVPNPNMQAQLVAEALQRAGVDARAVSYIEAQGTGSSLGDPIEIAGLSKAFRASTGDKQFCAIGSAKSNVGHCESAAGIVAISKVLMQMKHQTLVPSLHATTPNPEIDFANSPFSLQVELAHWARPVLEIDGRSREIPRIAGISSFGAGGANAHVVIEEYVAPARPQNNKKPALIVLSARNAERLQQQAQRLFDAISSRQEADIELDDLAYTLQVGREAMDDRLALTADSLDALRQKLSDFLAAEDGHGDIEGLHRGQVRRNKETMAIFANDDDMVSIVATWIARGKFDKILELWVKGLAVDWDLLYDANTRPRRISLPTYPFAKESYWSAKRRENSAGGGGILHPLLHRNTSDFHGPRFTSVFGTSDACVVFDAERSAYILPRTAQLEMARRAVSEITGDGAVIEIEEISWEQAAKVADIGLTAHVALALEPDHGVSFEIYSDSDDGLTTVYCRGRVAKENAIGPIDGTTPTAIEHAESLATTEGGKDAPVKLDAGTLQEKIKQTLVSMVSSMLKVKQDDIDGDTSLNEYGFDSISLTEFANTLNERLEADLTPTIFFEFPTLDGLAGFLANERSTAMLRHLAGQTPAESSAVKPTAAAAIQSASPIKTSTLNVSVGQASRFVQATRLRSHPAREPIAIIGMSGKFPMADGIDEFWRVLAEGKDCISEVPNDRWNWQELYGDPGESDNKTNIKWGGFIDGIAEFDPLFFGISPKEAELMDPQQRLMMQYVWKALEDAGYAGGSLAGSNTAIYVGTMASGYGNLISRAKTPIEGYSSTGSVASVGPNRMSYFLDFHGPSEPVETACSSSLVALRRAVLAIERGDCGMAIVGGVNTIVTPDLHISFNKAGMLSEDGRCKTFSSQANGYVRGEGVGMLVLKGLSAAERDGDHIYGLVRGTAENHGGRANSLTAPNPKAQAAVVRAAYEDGAIDPRTVTYIEAHGTGTGLGDPVEINGLKTAFRELYAGSGFNDSDVPVSHCGLGSAKTNVGHLELAAGVTGVIKVLLQMKHKKLVKSLHSETLNPYIDFTGSPFYVVQQARDWAALRDDAGRAIPRRAGVSSFGFGGVNAHVVLEEYVATAATHYQPSGPSLVVLSARNEARLQEQVQQLLDLTDAMVDAPNINLADLAYTLQVGREAMEERVALAVNSLAELRDKLNRINTGEVNIAEVYRGQVRRNKEAVAKFAADSELPGKLRDWVDQGQTGRVLELWVQGFNFDWNLLYLGQRPRRISLPTYPFAKERYWVSTDMTAPQDAGAVMHPLLQRNSSLLSGPRYTSHFAGSEFFLADHIVQGNPVLPGVAQLEMARCAVSAALEGAGPLRLTDIVWSRPVVVGADGLDLHIALYPQERGVIGYEIYSDGGDGEPVVYGQGNVIEADSVGAASHDLAALRQQCTQAHLSAAQCYGLFEQMGLHYGPGFQGLNELFVGQQPGQQQGQLQALARITLPLSVQAQQERYVLHPSLLDAALQASIGLQSDVAKLMLPFALGELELLAPCTANMWAVVRHSAGSAAGDAIQKLDIDLCGDSGVVCVRFKQFSLRAVAVAAVAEADKSIESLLLQPQWIAQPAETAAPTAYTRHIVVLCGMDAIDLEQIRRHLPQAVVLKALHSNDLAQNFEAAAALLLEQLQALSGQPGRHLIQVAVPNQGQAQTMSGLSGMLRSAQLENPRITGQVIELDNSASIQELVQVLAENRNSTAQHLRYGNDGQGSSRMVSQWTPLPATPDAAPRWKDQGVYLITGGAGGLGLIFARAIAGHAKGATLVLTGRALPTEATLAEIRKLEGHGAVVQYRQVDVGDAQAVSALVHGIDEEFEGLDGIIHSAGVVRDSFLIRKTREQLQQVLRAKVAGTINLDQASRDIALDCFICFSSIAGALGNIGQADYAAGNAFMDAYAQQRNNLVVQRQRHGKTLSINWPLWAEGGMQVDAATRQYLERETGMTPLGTDSGLKALNVALGSNAAQVLLAHGQLTKLKSSLMNLESAGSRQEISAVLPKHAAELPSNQNMPEESDEMQEKTVRYFVRLLSTALKLPSQQIDAHARMETYGIDSILVLDLTRTLEKVFGPLPKTLFFEYQTIAALSEYFLQNHAALMDSLIGLRLSGQQAVQQTGPQLIQRSVPAAKAAATLPSRISRYESRKQVDRAPESGFTEIAIIGLAGRYPQAANIEQFWTNLSQGKDCITEIPGERWDHSLYFDEDRNKPGKTYGKWGGFIDGVDKFDPLFFNISPREAELMDPQERLFLECVYATLEDAGYTREALAGREGSSRDANAGGSVGVFVGVMYEEYQLYGAQEQARGRQIAVPGNPASIANRVSYFCNFTGPSMAIDTMCSSSLTAIHLACQSLQRGNCTVAIAGGVNVSVHPNKYLMLAQGKFASAKGRCESFGEGGEGYVPGEGVGAILLKPKAQAIADGDHIYGVIKATAINHGGKTNGYTVPNPTAQARVIEQALRDGGIDARSVSYVEAHGTGTSLGDPIEIAGLSRAFQEWTQDKQFCAIGSAKSNIGHCESAAGIAGVTKVLLQMKHRQLVPSLHSKSLNPNIDFANTPFIVQQELSPWNRPVLEAAGVTNESPRIAGISSFGAGGANAHVVIEEYAVPEAEEQASGGTALIVLSARDEARLREQMHLLLAALEPDKNIALADIAYTLQVGREAMEERLALAVESVVQLREKLQALIAGAKDVDETYRGQVKRNMDALIVFAADDDLLKAVQAWVQKGKFGKLLDLWVKGLRFDWHSLYGTHKPRRISLPTYPFARERYWIELSADAEAASSKAIGNLHPLLHRNTSTLAAQRYTSHFAGSEIFLADHIVQGNPVLPGVAQLEMARCAVSAALEGAGPLRLTDIVWSRPVVVGADGLDLH
ncbi:MAG TPA: SDR family NAD(P)-dependent oxidoreductase, partial [Burkholderiaceae bacterium]